MSNMQSKIKTMLEMQDEINIRTRGEDWRDQGHNWCRAIWVECAELMDHYGWKWWKLQEPDIAQVRMELVDIWHFILSFRLQYNWSDYLQDEFAKYMVNTWNITKPECNILAVVEDIASRALDGHPMYLQFCEACHLMGLSFDDLYKMYIGKNILNKFRQDNGYQDGTYRKIWDGREDNVVLAEILEAVNDEWEEDELFAYIENSLSCEYEMMDKPEPLINAGDFHNEFCEGRGSL